MYLKVKIIAVLLLISTLLSLGDAVKVGAASSFDDAITPAENILVGRGGGGVGSCQPINVSSDWLDRITNNASYDENPTAATNLSNFKNQLLTNIGSGAGWFVASQKGSSSPEMLFVAKFDPSAAIDFGYYYGNADLPMLRFSSMFQWYRFEQRASDCQLIIDDNGTQPLSNSEFIVDVAYDPTNETEILQLASDNVNYPVGYEGANIPVTTTWADLDADGLLASAEDIQGTSNFEKDTDGDGLDDYVESQWYPSRSAVFCDNSQCTNHAYPNPTTKDLYVEVDWVEKDARDYVPSASQISDVVDAYSSEGILAHFDTGQLGGGQQVLTDEALTFAPTENALDFYDLKNGTDTISANFDPVRKNIWHYMISGPNFMESDNVPGSTGASYTGDDDSVISIEKVEDMNPTDVDTAVTGTILHELGHNLCLSNETSIYYPNQPSNCVYGEIDKSLDQNPSQDYGSVMNYRYQLTRMNYSHGSNGVPNDHDDWQAIGVGMNDFIDSVFEWDDSQNQSQQRRGSSDSRPSRQDMIDNIQ